MPGITGFIDLRSIQGKDRLLDRMLASMRHESFYASGKVVHEALGLWLGWTALEGSFADGMPQWNEKGDVGLVFSGEDFRDPADARRLEALGHGIGGRAADYLVHLYEDTGDRFFEKLNGRFNGIILDLKDKKVHIFNDRFGLNRIYYHETRDGLYFSSEAKALLAVLPELRRLDDQGLGEAFTCGCVLQNRSLFTGISLMPGGSVWTAGPGPQIRKRSYFLPDAWESQAKLAAEDYAARLKETWARILPRYLRQNERLAMSLTGGKDGRMIMAWAQAAPGTLPCYTFRGMYRESRDTKLARAVADMCRQEYHVLKLDRGFLEEFADLAERTVFLTDGAMDVSGAAELYMNRLARRIAPIRLTGNYGQEILRASVAFKPVQMSGGIFNGDFVAMTERAGQTYREELAGPRLSFVVFKQVPWHHYSRLALELSQVTLRSPFLDQDLVALAYRSPLSRAEAIESQLRLIAEGSAALGRIGTDRGLKFQSDSTSTRLRQLWQAFTFKAEYAYDYGMPQWVSKVDRVFKPVHLERLFLGRHKYYHFRKWYRDELSGYVKEILLDPQTLGRPYLERKGVEKLVKSHTSGSGNYTMEIHRLLTLEHVQRRLVQNRPG
jgi:asparagine synthase (glutamine-hydrolysing)